MPVSIRLRDCSARGGSSYVFAPIVSADRIIMLMTTVWNIRLDSIRRSWANLLSLAGWDDMKNSSKNSRNVKSKGS
jgi:hypothetical protein